MTLRWLAISVILILVGCASINSEAHSEGAVYLDLIVIEGGATTYPDPIHPEIIGRRIPIDFHGAIDALGKIVTTGKGASESFQSSCALKLDLPLSHTYETCKYKVCSLLPPRSRIQDCGYFVRLEQWVQREWLGGLCVTEGINESSQLARWFIEHGISDCTAMSELIIVGYMQDLAGLPRNEPQLLLHSSFQLKGTEEINPPSGTKNPAH